MSDKRRKDWNGNYYGNGMENTMHCSVKIASWVMTVYMITWFSVLEPTRNGCSIIAMLQQERSESVDLFNISLTEYSLKTKCLCAILRLVYNARRHELTETEWFQSTLPPTYYEECFKYCVWYRSVVLSMCIDGLYLYKHTNNPCHLYHWLIQLFILLHTSRNQARIYKMISRRLALQFTLLLSFLKGKETYNYLKCCNLKCCNVYSVDFWNDGSKKTEVPSYRLGMQKVTILITTTNHDPVTNLKVS